MKAAQKEQLTANLIQQAASRWGLTSSWQKLGDFENLVLRVDDTVLRITHEGHRCAGELLAEIDFMLYLAKAGEHVPCPLADTDGQYLYKLETPTDRFFVLAYKMINGRHVKTTDATPQFIRDWGRLTGRLHKLSLGYVPGTQRRRHWTDEEASQFGVYLNKEDADLAEYGNNYRAQVAALPEISGAFGLIHADIHMGNLLVTADSPAVIDWDDSCYNYFAYDVMIPLFYAMGHWQQQSGMAPLDFARNMLDTFMSGYEQEHHLDDFWQQQIPLLAKLREVCVYESVYRCLDLPSMAKEEVNSILADLNHLRIQIRSEKSFWDEL